MEKVDLENHFPSSSSKRPASHPLHPPGQEHPLTHGKRETPPGRTTAGRGDNHPRGHGNIRNSRMSHTKLRLFDPLFRSKLKTESSRRARFDPHPSRTSSSASGTNKSAFKGNNNQHSPQRANNVTIPQRSNKAEQTSRIVSWIRSRQGSPFPSSSSSLSSSSSTSSRLKTQIAVQPRQFANLPKSSIVLASRQQPSWSPELIYSSPTNRTRPRLTASVPSSSFLTSFSLTPVVIDLTLHDAPEASETSEIKMTSPSSPTTRSPTSSSSSQETVATSATTMSLSPSTSAVPENFSHKDFNTTSALLTHPSKSAPQLPRKRGRPLRNKPTRAILGSALMSYTPSPVQAYATKRREKSECVSNFTVSSRLGTNASIELSIGSTTNPSEQDSR